MAGVLLNYGQEWFLQLAFNGLYQSNLYLGLMTNTVNPLVSQNVGSGITEITGDNYIRLLITKITDWTVVNSVVTCVQKTFVVGLSGWNNVGGYFIATTGFGNDTAIIAEAFPLNRQGNKIFGQTIPIVPSYEQKDSTE